VLGKYSSTPISLALPSGRLRKHPLAGRLWGQGR
jgi:hypothetical protein